MYKLIIFLLLPITVYSSEVRIQIKKSSTKNAETNTFSSLNMFKNHIINYTCIKDNCYYLADENIAEILVRIGVADSYEPNHTFRYFDAQLYSEPDDVHFTEQWHLKDTTINWLGGYDLIKNITPSGVTAAIIDSGYVPHIDATDVTCINIVDNNSTCIDKKGHGTHVTGIVSAKTNNNVAIAGTDYGKGKIISINAHNSIINDLYYNDIDKAMAKILELHEISPILVVNMSFGGEHYSEYHYNAIKAMRNKGIIVTASTGNDGKNLKDIDIYPVGYELENIIGTASIKSDLTMADNSNYGAYTDIAAPGVRITSFGVGGTNLIESSGTSMSAPFIAGLLVAGKTLGPNLTPQQLVQILYSTATTQSTLNNKVNKQRLVNAGKFLTNIKSCSFLGAMCTVPSTFPPREYSTPVTPPTIDPGASASSSSGGCSMASSSGIDIISLLFVAGALIFVRKKIKIQ